MHIEYQKMLFPNSDKAGPLFAAPVIPDRIPLLQHEDHGHALLGAKHKDLVRLAQALIRIGRGDGVSSTGFSDRRNAVTRSSLS